MGCFPVTRRFVLTTALAAWLCAVAVGICSQVRYDHTAGATRAPPVSSDALALAPALAARAGRPLLVMAVHPRCPCTRASVEELADLAAPMIARVDDAASTNADRPLDIAVLVCLPDAGDASWSDAPLCARIRAIDGVRLILDRDGLIAASLGMRTSGHVVVYDAARRLVFSGGITAARGERGDTPACETLRAFVAALLAPDHAARFDDASEPAVRTAPVFGCALVHSPDSLECRGVSSNE